MQKVVLLRQGCSPLPSLLSPQHPPVLCLLLRAPGSGRRGLFEAAWPSRAFPWVSLQVFAFFKGMSFPLASIAVYNSVVFGVFSNTQRFLSRHRCPEAEAGPPHMLSDLLLASMVAGVVSVGLGAPVDLIKIRLQMQTQPLQEGKRPGEGA